MPLRSAEGGPELPPKVPLIKRLKLQSLAWQLAVLALLIALAVIFVLNAKANLQAQRITSGFGFLDHTAGFAINQSLIAYSETDTYARVFLVGLLNTLLVAGVGIVLATLLGFLIGIARLSPNWLVARLAGGYVELIRNLPLLFQILFWYLAVLGTMPGPRQSIAIGLQPMALSLAEAAAWLQAYGIPAAIAEGLRAFAEWVGPPEIFLNNRGLILPRPVTGKGAQIVGYMVLIAVVAAIALRIWAARRQAATGRQFPVFWIGTGLIIGLPLVTFIALGSPITLERPELRGFNFAGGMRLIPEFTALLIALVTYTAAFIAEVVRAGILAVSRGQTEAAISLGLTRMQTLRLIVVPQALRVIVPPLTNQYLNLTKNSSLAVAVGYPDLVAVFAGTALNQTGQAIEIIAITMAVYLTLSLITSLAMNLYNARIRLSER
jgi:general L-amino acid transport system permease protein